MNSDPTPASHQREAQEGILIGNQVDKSQLRNPISRRMVAGFDSALLRLIGGIQPAPTSVHEVGCGEGRLTRKLRDHLGIEVRASDFSERLIIENQSRNEAHIQYVVRSVYDLDASDRAELIVCCEVLEHLERPADALAALRALRGGTYLFSVPCEPLWRVLNLARGKYLAALGNTPGHLNHWSRRGFLNFLAASGFRPDSSAQPLPWTMVRGRFDPA